MSKEPVPLQVADLSQFARSLATQLNTAEGVPSHLSLLNMLARAARFKNYQHLRSSVAAKARVEAPSPTLDYKKIERVLQQFDAQGRMRQWPAKRQVQELCLWVMWSHLPGNSTMEERDVNGILNKEHLFDDAALLRRSLIGMKLLDRTRDGSDYRRQEHAPPAEAVYLIREMVSRRNLR